MLVCKVSHSLQCFFDCKDTKKSATSKENCGFFYILAHFLCFYPPQWPPMKPGVALRTD